jgi:hypothetical protein
VVWKDRKYSYRQVRWTERQAEQANIVANRAGGEWDFEILTNRFSVEDLLNWGFEPVEFKRSDDPPEAEPREEPQLASEQLIEIRCSTRDLVDFQGKLDEWAKRATVTIDIS